MTERKCDVEGCNNPVEVEGYSCGMCKHKAWILHQSRAPRISTPMHYDKPDPTMTVIIWLAILTIITLSLWAIFAWTKTTAI